MYMYHMYHYHAVKDVFHMLLSKEVDSIIYLYENMKNESFAYSKPAIQLKGPLYMYLYRFLKIL